MAAAVKAAQPAQTAQPAAKSNSKTPEEFAAEKKKRRKRRKRKVMLSLFIILLIIAACVAALYYTGVIKSLLQLIGFEKPIAVMSDIEQEQRFQQWQTELENWEYQLDERELELENEKNALIEREKAVEEREQNARTFSSVLGDTPEERVAVLERLGGIYDKMEVEKAVATIEEMYTVDEMAIIVYYMSDETAAAVLAGMTPSIATQIVSMMIG